MCLKSCNLEYKKLLTSLEKLGCQELYEDFLVAENSCERIQMFQNAFVTHPNSEFISGQSKFDNLSLLEVILYENLETAQKHVDNVAQQG